MPDITTPNILMGMVTIDGHIMHWKIINSGVWDMNADHEIAVPHGLGASWANIISINVMVVSDLGTMTTLDDFNDGADPNLIRGGIAGWDDTNITLDRRTGSLFDSVNYDSVLMNRALIVIGYFE